MPDNRFDDLFAEADDAFNGKYKNELNELMGLSKAEIIALTPETTDLSPYNKLIEVVKQASKNNMSQSNLITNIKSLGDLAIKIAKKVPAFANLL